MSLIVSDASPVHYLILIHAVDVLPRLFSKVVIPEYVVSVELQKGEEDTISLALELNAPVLLDEREARKVAEERGLLVVGLVGIIERAAAKNMLDIRIAFAALQKTNFRVSETLLDAAVQRHVRTAPPQT